MRKYKATEILDLLTAVANAAGKKPVYRDFDAITNAVKRKTGASFGADYLYKHVYAQVKNPSGEKEVTLNDEHIESLATYLEFESFSEFIRNAGKPLSPVLLECLGSWRSYVRCNSGEEYVLCSPVEITRIKRTVLVKLKGPVRSFCGELNAIGNSVHSLLTTDTGKAIHIIFYVGVSKKARVLQGIFSGVSSASDPIAGREILVRADEDFTLIQNERLSIASLLKSKDPALKAVGKYFNTKPGNMLKAGTSSTFSFGDLLSNADPKQNK